VKDLCVAVDEDLKFHKHVANAENKASRMLGLIRKALSLLDETTVPRLLFTAMVRPHLENPQNFFIHLTTTSEVTVKKCSWDDAGLI